MGGFLIGFPPQPLLWCSPPHVFAPPQMDIRLNKKTGPNNVDCTAIWLRPEEHVRFIGGAVPGLRGGHQPAEAGHMGEWRPGRSLRQLTYRVDKNYGGQEF